MPPPWTHPLTLGDSGPSVLILQHLVARVPTATLDFTSVFDAKTKAAVLAFQHQSSLDPDGIFGSRTATALLDGYSDDGYKDDGTIPSWAKYKVHIPVHRNRSIEVQATLYDSSLHPRHKFTVRTHGQHELNQFSGSGSTPTGLSSFDLNTPENDPKLFGPYPINRFVQGIAGNAQFLVSDIRDGLLMHTGEWPDWKPSDPMPNSHGCVHAHPDDIKSVWQILTNDLGVQVHNNTFGKLPYPWKPQGVVSIELVP